jgi:hypothetical protein
MLYSNLVQGKPYNIEHKELCPFHNDTGIGSFSINLKTGLYNCFSCGAKGNIISYVKQVYNIENYPEIVKFINNKVGYEVIILNKDNEEFTKRKVDYATELDTIRERKDTDRNKLLENKYLMSKFGSKLDSYPLRDYILKDENIFTLKENFNYQYANKNGEITTQRFSKDDLLFDFGSGIQRIIFQPSSKQNKFILGSFSNSSYLIEIDKKQPYFVCEGLATALSYVAIGYNAIVGISLSNMVKVTAHYKDLFCNLYVSFDNISQENKEKSLTDRGNYINEYKFQSIDFEDHTNEKKGFDANDLLNKRDLNSFKQIIDDKISNFNFTRYLDSQNLRIYHNKKNEYVAIINNAIYDVKKRGNLIDCLVDNIKWRDSWNTKDLRKLIDNYISRIVKPYDRLGYAPSLPYTSEFNKFNKILINTYKESGLQQKAEKYLYNEKFNHIEKLLQHLTENNQDYYNWFINFLVNKIKQPEIKPHIGIIFYSNGTTGTGKTTLARILKAIFGENINTEVKQTSIASGRNGFFFDVVLWIAEEVSLESSNIMQLIKTALTSDYMTIVDKYVIDTTKENYANGIFFSDKILPLKLDADDRRFVVFKVDVKIDPKIGEFFKQLDKIEVVKELESFYRYLLHYNNIQDVELLHTESKQELLKVGKDNEEEFIEEIIEELASVYFEHNASDYIVKTGDELLIFSTKIRKKLIKFAIETKTALLTYQVLCVKLAQLTFSNKKIKIFSAVVRKNKHIKALKKVENVFIIKFSKEYIKYYTDNKNKESPCEVQFDSITGEILP